MHPSHSGESALKPAALTGIRVLDLSRVLAGPWASQTLGDLGAEIIKVERPQTGDDTRGWGPPYLKDGEGEPTSDAAYYLCTNRNKKSIAIDIATPNGQLLVRDLAKQCDVVIENFKVGSLQQYGLDYESLRAINPRLIYCSITGYGATGPESELKAYDLMVQASSGLMSVTGKPDGAPYKSGSSVSDCIAGTFALSGVLGALFQRTRTGEGQFIDVTAAAILARLSRPVFTDEMIGRFHLAGDEDRALWVTLLQSDELACVERTHRRL